jgi:hypothetical protein
MAATISRYNHTAKKLMNKEVDYTALKIMLLDNTASFTATHTKLSDVAGSANAKEVSGNGWTAGGETLASVAVTTVDTNGAMLDAADVEKTASGGSIGAAYNAVIYDDTDSDDAPLWFIAFGEAKTADDGTPFKVAMNASGLARITQAA